MGAQSTGTRVTDTCAEAAVGRCRVQAPCGREGRGRTRFGASTFASVCILTCAAVVRAVKGRGRVCCDGRARTLKYVFCESVSAGAAGVGVGGAGVGGAGVGVGAGVGDEGASAGSSPLILTATSASPSAPLSILTVAAGSSALQPVGSFATVELVSVFAGGVSSMVFAGRSHGAASAALGWAAVEDPHLRAARFAAQPPHGRATGRGKAGNAAAHPISLAPTSRRACAEALHTRAGPRPRTGCHVAGEPRPSRGAPPDV